MTSSYCITLKKKKKKKIQTHLSQSCGNFFFKSHQDELGRSRDSREGYSGNSDYGGVIRAGNGAVMWN